MRMHPSGHSIAVMILNVRAQAARLLIRVRASIAWVCPWWMDSVLLVRSTNAQKDIAGLWETEDLKFSPFYYLRFAYAIAGVFVAFVGVIGWILPFVPGLPLVIIGLSMMATIHPAAHRWCQGLKNKSVSSFHKLYAKPQSPAEIRKQFSSAPNVTLKDPNNVWR